MLIFVYFPKILFASSFGLCRLLLLGFALRSQSRLGLVIISVQRVHSVQRGEVTPETFCIGRSKRSKASEIGKRDQSRFVLAGPKGPRRPRLESETRVVLYWQVQKVQSVRERNTRPESCRFECEALFRPCRDNVSRAVHSRISRTPSACWHGANSVSRPVLGEKSKSG